MGKLYKFLNIITLGTIDDIKWIGIIIKRLAKGEPVVNADKWAEYKTDMKKTRPKSYFKKYWLWFLCIAFAFIMGWMFTAQYYEIKCNNYIIETYVKPKMMENLNGSIWRAMNGSILNKSGIQDLTPVFPFVPEPIS